MEQTEKTALIGQQTKSKRRFKKLRWAIILLIGLILTALNSIWMTYMQVIWNQGYSTLLCIYFNTIFTLVLLVLVNAGIRRVRPSIAMTSIEMLVLFIMGNVGTSVALLGEYIVSNLAYPYYYGVVDNKLLENLSLSQWLTVSDHQAARDFYLGGANIWKWSSLKHWIRPLICWGAFLVAMIWTGICISAIVYNRWRHEEKLSFPLLQIPLMITDQKSNFHKSWLFWIAFGLAAGINIINALSKLYPVVPDIAVKRQALVLDGLARPWSALSPVLYSLNPFLIGLEFFLPLDLLFSVFFFYWMDRMQGVLINYMGVDYPYSPDSMVAPFVREQSVGAILALLAFSLWMAKGRWNESWTKMKSILPIDTAKTGALFGALAMMGVLVFAGMPPMLVVAFVLVYLAIVVSLARIRAQYGPPGAGLFLAAPGTVIYNIVGTSGLQAQGLSSLHMLHTFEWDYTNHPMPDTLEGISMTENKVSPKVFIAAILLAGVVGYVAAYGTVLVSGYKLGQATARSGGTQMYYGKDACMTFITRFSNQVRGMHADSVGAMGIGAVFVLILQAIRTKFIAFPLHPVGYAIASTYTSTFLWSTAMITWLIKLVTLRYAGLKGYKAATPFFLGLVIGEFTIGSILSLIGVFTGTRLYVFWPY